MTDWKSCLENPRGRFTHEWFANHVATKELLASGPFVGHVLDVGCGIGGRAYAVAKAYPDSEVHGIDVSIFAIAYARENFSLDNTHYCFDDATAMPLQENDSFDVVFTLGVIEHVHDTTQFLGEIRRVLRPGGRFFLAVTNEDYHKDSEHVHVYTLDEMLDLMKLSSFVVEEGYIKENIIFVQATIGLPKLNLGCGGVYLPGYVNIDKVAWGSREPDLIADVLDLNMYDDGTVDHIHNYGLLEHIPPWNTMRALREWARVLRPGGTIHIEVPDLIFILEGWKSGALEEYLALNYIYGANKSANKVYEDQHHLTGFTYSRLASMMSQAGFTDICRVDSERMRWALAVEATREEA